MSEVMLHAVLRMPIECWDNSSIIDMKQRHSRYLEASDLIQEQQKEIDHLKNYVGDNMIRSDYKTADAMRAEIKRLKAIISTQQDLLYKHDNF